MLPALLGGGATTAVPGLEFHHAGAVAEPAAYGIDNVEPEEFDIRAGIRVEIKLLRTGGRIPGS